MIAIFIFVILAMLALIHGLIYKFIVTIFPITTIHGLFYTRAFFVVLTISFLAASLLSSRFNTLLSRLFYTISATLLGFALYIFIAAVLFALVSVVVSYTHPTLSILLYGRILLAVALIVGIYGVIHANTIQVTEVSVHINNLPESWKGRKAVFLSDVHLGQIRNHAFAEKITTKILEINPDIIFNAGDLYDGVKVDPDMSVAPFAQLHPKLGSFFAMGNHEEFSDNTQYAKAIEKAGITILNDQMVNIEGVQIIGIDYNTSTTKASYDALLKKLAINTAKPSILVKHVPFNLDSSEAAGVSLQLSGHTHRAQVFPLSLITKIVYHGYDYGLKPLRNMQVYTSSGVGSWGPPLRVGTKSEIVVLTFN